MPERFRARCRTGTELNGGRFKRLRATANRPFGPPHSPRFVDSLRGELATVVTTLLDAFEGKDQVDIVDGDF
ncbi:hypothetical protein [Streptomyces sp. NPDC005525]|uniref:hypothetical protein n=1 Tax=Streptomyces sp. NPDC005525 TaxID=3364720 RepID=UPI0036CE06E8